MILENWSDVGIFIEISGFVLLLFFWKLPSYSNLHLWKKSQIIYKIIFGEEKYVRRISDNKTMSEDDTITRSSSILSESDNKVPKDFLGFWKFMRIFSILVVISGLILQLAMFNPPSPT